jgi:hypothetical protein
MNPLFSLFTGGGNPANSVMLQALGAAMRGESPEVFMQNLAKTNPQLQGLDLNNLEGTARTLAQQQGKDLNALANEVKATVNKLM